MRRALGGWRRESIAGEPLKLADLSSPLTRTGNYRMTICAVEESAYLIRRIRGVAHPLHQRAAALNADLKGTALQLIQGLHWREFETFADLLFARGGWRRTSLLGADMPDADLLLEQPITGETAWVQVKARAGQRELEDYLGHFERNGGFDRFFFVCHSPRGALRLPNAAAHLHLWTGERLAEAALDVGLFGWLMERNR